jgi:hypothetical protein
MQEAESLYPSRYKFVTKQETTENLVRFVYAFEGVGLYLDPYLYSEEITHIPFSEKIKLKSLDCEISFNYKWYKVDYEGNIVYISEKWIGEFPPPFETETIELYAERLTKIGFDIEIDIYNMSDRQEYKLLLPSKNMREIFNIARMLYPLDFKYPRASNKVEEVLTKIDHEKDIYEEFEVTRNTNEEVIMLDYIADFGTSSDSVTLRLRSDNKILLIFGSYCQEYKKSIQ